VRLAAIVLVLFLASVASAPAAPWQRPLAGPVARAFSVSADRFARGQHRGVDLAAAPGTRVRAVCAGRVRFAGSVPGGGRTVSVGCGRLAATYQHLGAVQVQRGQLLAAGVTIGTVGGSGRPRGTRPHLHLGAREAATGRYVDPAGLFGGAPPARTLPPVAGAPQRRLLLGLAPRAAPPRLVPVVVPETAPAPGFEPGDAPAAHVPMLVWLGLAAFGLGLPLGAVVGQRRRRRNAATAAARARRWAAAHR
jgi:murein DD-endopeptidase MepM/ murein hydrolase activator NlpD